MEVLVGKEEADLYLERLDYEGNKGTIFIVDRYVGGRDLIRGWQLTYSKMIVKILNDGDFEGVIGLKSFESCEDYCEHCIGVNIFGQSESDFETRLVTEINSVLFAGGVESEARGSGPAGGM